MALHLRHWGSGDEFFCSSGVGVQSQRVVEWGQRFEQGLVKLCQALAKPRGEKRLIKITERIGRLKEKCRGIGQHYRIEYQTEASGTKIMALTWTKEISPGSQMSDPGLYCLRSNETSWTKEQMWRTYVMLTDLEAVF